MTTTRAARLRTLAALVAASAFLSPRPLAAQEHEHGEEHEHVEGHESDEGHHHGALHFSHPLVAESVTPDTKFRLDAHFANGNRGSTLAFVFEGEYAFAPAFSIEMDVTPYTHAFVPSAIIDEPAGSGLPIQAHLAATPAGVAEKSFSELGVSFKFANFAFAEHRMLLGYGATLGLPLRRDGEPVHAVTTIEPFLDIGYQQAGWELEGFTRFAIPTAAEEGEPGHADLLTNVSLLRHFTPRLQGLIELDSSSPLGGGDDPTLVHLTPGLKVRPSASNEHLIVGFGVRMPVSDSRLFYEQGIVSVFWHF